MRSFYPFRARASYRAVRAVAERVRYSCLITEHDDIGLLFILKSEGFAFQFSYVKGSSLLDGTQVFEWSGEEYTFLSTIFHTEQLVLEQVEPSPCHQLALRIEQCHQCEEARAPYFHVFGHGLFHFGTLLGQHSFQMKTHIARFTDQMP